MLSSGVDGDGATPVDGAEDAGVLDADGAGVAVPLEHAATRSATTIAAGRARCRLERDENTRGPPMRGLG